MNENTTGNTTGKKIKDLEMLVEARKEKARKLQLFEKCYEITEILGKEYVRRLGEYYEVGRVYEDAEIKVTMGENNYDINRDNAKIEIVETAMIIEFFGLFRKKSTEYIPVYECKKNKGKNPKETDYCTDTFKDENTWLDYFESLYKLAIEQKAKGGLDKEKEEYKVKSKSAKDNFGVVI